MNAQLLGQIEASFAMYDELVASLSADQLRQKLPVPSNTIGEQLWCVVGARESWARAIEKGAWDGFSCSLVPAEVTEPSAMARGLQTSAAALLDALAHAPGDDTRTGLLLDLLVHESQHQGQLLRYLLGLRIEVPGTWKERFAL